MTRNTGITQGAWAADLTRQTFLLFFLRRPAAEQHDYQPRHKAGNTRVSAVCDSAEPNSLAGKIFNTPASHRASQHDERDDCCSLITNPAIQLSPARNVVQPGTGIGQAIGNGGRGSPTGHLRPCEFQFHACRPVQRRLTTCSGRISFSTAAITCDWTISMAETGRWRMWKLAPHSLVETVGWTRTLTNVLLNEARFNFTRWTFDQIQNFGNHELRIPQIRLFDFDAGGLGMPVGSWAWAGPAQTPAGWRRTPSRFAIPSIGFGEPTLEIWRGCQREQNNNMKAALSGRTISSVVY